MAPLLGYYKSDPTDYILLYHRGKVLREGTGLAFFYWTPTASIVSVPISTMDVPFILNEATGNFQAITVQGQLTYRIANPRTMANILKFTIDPRTRKFIDADPEKVAQRIINAIQTHVRPELSQRSLEDALRQAADIAVSVLARVKTDPTLAAMGVECLDLFFNAIKPTPEMAMSAASRRAASSDRCDNSGRTCIWMALIMRCATFSGSA